MAALESADEPQAEGRAKSRNRARNDVQGDRIGCGKARRPQNLRQVVHRRVDAGQLVEAGEANADESEAPRPTHSHRPRKGPGAFALGALVQIDNLTDLICDVVALGIADLFERADRLDIVEVRSVPASRLGHKAHPDPQENRGDRREDEHPPPRSAVSTENDDIGHGRGLIPTQLRGLCDCRVNGDVRAPVAVGEHRIH